MIEITGTGFKPGLKVILTAGGKQYMGTGTRLLGSTSVETTLPLRSKSVPAGRYSVIVVNPDGTFGSKISCFTVKINSATSKTAAVNASTGLNSSESDAASPAGSAEPSGIFSRKVISPMVSGAIMGKNSGDARRKVNS